MNDCTRRSLPAWWHRLLLLTHIYLIIHFGNAAGPSDCFFMDGTNSSLSPCVPAEKRSSGEHSACCNLGDPPNNANDICTSDGLCFWTDATDARTMLFRNGCTDSSLTDGACGAYCVNGSKFKRMQSPCADDGSQKSSRELMWTKS